MRMLVSMTRISGATNPHLVLLVRLLLGAVNYSDVVREYEYRMGLNGFRGLGNVRPPCHGEGARVNFPPGCRVETKGALLNDKHRAANAAHQPSSHHS